MRAVLLLALGLIWPRTAPAEPVAPAPRASVTVFTGDVGDQKFTVLSGELARVTTDGRTTTWRCLPVPSAGARPAIALEATSTTEGDAQRWSYRVTNDQPSTTVCEVTFPTIEGVRFGDSWAGNRVLWPSMYTGALVEALGSQEAFEAQAKIACKGVPYLYGMYQGDLCLPFFVHLGSQEFLSVTVLDPTHEVLSLFGTRHPGGMRYEVAAHPRIPAGRSWSFGEIEVRRGRTADWHPVADRYREWLIAQGFRPPLPRRGDVAALMYGRWDGLLPQEAIAWARALDIHDVCLWLPLYGRGDQYYPCYFPPPDLGVAGMSAKLGALRAAGLAPYFYTNGYLLSPLQTAADALAWSARHPQGYPEWMAKGDRGYAEIVAKFRAEGNDYAGDWLAAPGGVERLRVRRVSFQWGEFPLYFWHQRPFWAACVATPEWRKLFCDTARLHAQMGAAGIYLDQTAAIAPELCSALGHGHDDDSFGLWNRAYLRLLAETQRAGETIAPGFLMEAEGASDLYARYFDRYLCNFGPNAYPPPSCPRLLRYTIPWARFDCGQQGYDDATAMTAHIQRTLLLGGIFRATGGAATGAEAPAPTTEAAGLLRAGIRTRRTLAPFMDAGRYMDEVGLRSEGCSAARWFDGGPNGTLVVALAEGPGARVHLHTGRRSQTRAAWSLDWRTGARSSAHANAVAGEVSVGGLAPGLNLVVIP